MKRYFVWLGLLTVVMLLLAMATRWLNVAFFAPVAAWVLPVATLYFAIVSGVQYYLTVSSVNKNPRTFVQLVLGTTVATLFLHLGVLVGGMLMNPAAGKRFAVGFLILYVVYTVFTTAWLVHFMRHAGDKAEE